MHKWQRNDAAKVNVVNDKGEVTHKIHRVLAVTRENLPTIRVGNEEIMAKHEQEWEHVGQFVFTFNPLTPGDPFYKFVPAK